MQAVILAGGLGTRLKPFTDIIPKPMLPFGDKSLLEIQIELLRRHGVKEIFLALNYKADYIRSFFGDGRRLGVKLHYSVEPKPLGTAGPLSLLRERLTGPFFVMNGDILTQADLSNVERFSARDGEAIMTIVTKVIATPFRFGAIVAEGDVVQSIEEKPDLSFEILAGIYRLTLRALDFIPDDTYYGIDHLIQDLLQRKERVVKHRLREYWVDIGMVEDYEHARKAYDEHFSEDP